MVQVRFAGEAMATAFNDRYGLKVIGLRYMNVYGPHQDQTAAYTGVVPIMLNKIEGMKRPLLMVMDLKRMISFMLKMLQDRIFKHLQVIKTLRMYNVGTERFKQRLTNYAN